MSSPIWDAGEGLRSTGEMLNDFLYVDGKPMLKKNVPGIKKEHTKEELEEMLENIRQSAWSSYDSLANELGWK